MSINIPGFLRLLFCFFIAAGPANAADTSDRAKALIDSLPGGELKSTLQACASQPVDRSEFSIGHRGAPFKYPEHTREGYIAAIESGAGIVECDVTFTKDQALVCRHSQCDLHSSTNILETPLVEKCSVPPDMNSRTPFSDVKCCTSDISLSEFRSLQGRFDKVNKKAKTLAEYLKLPDELRARAAVTVGTLMSHADSIELFSANNVKMIPELKAAQVAMPYQTSDGQIWTQQQYAQALVNEYIAAEVMPENVFLQSFNFDDITYWIENAPAYSKQVAWLDGRYRDRSFEVNKPKTWKPSMTELADADVPILAPPLWMLLTLDKNENIVPSKYALAAKEAGLDIVGWTLERSGSLSGGGGWYYQTIKPVVKDDSAIYSALHVLAKDVGVRGMFSDWPETTTYYANCLKLD